MLATKPTKDEIRQALAKALRETVAEYTNDLRELRKREVEGAERKLRKNAPGGSSLMGGGANAAPGGSGGPGLPQSMAMAEMCSTHGKNTKKCGAKCQEEMKKEEFLDKTFGRVPGAPKKKAPTPKELEDADEHDVGDDDEGASPYGGDDDLERAEFKTHDTKDKMKDLFEGPEPKVLHPSDKKPVKKDEDGWKEGSKKPPAAGGKAIAGSKGSGGAIKTGKALGKSEALRKDVESFRPSSLSQRSGRPALPGMTARVVPPTPAPKLGSGANIQAFDADAGGSPDAHPATTNSLNDVRGLRQQPAPYNKWATSSQAPPGQTDKHKASMERLRSDLARVKKPALQGHDDGHASQFNPPGDRNAERTANHEAANLAEDKKLGGVGWLNSLVSRMKGAGNKTWAALRGAGPSSPARANRTMGSRMALSEKPAGMPLQKSMPGLGTCVMCGAGEHAGGCSGVLAKGIGADPMNRKAPTPLQAQSAQSVGKPSPTANGGNSYFFHAGAEGYHQSQAKLHPTGSPEHSFHTQAAAHHGIQRTRSSMSPRNTAHSGTPPSGPPAAI